MKSHGVVRSWSDDDGCGVIDSADTPGGCWAGFAAVEMAGLRTLRAGQKVDFIFEVGRQDAFDYRAVQVWPRGAKTRPERDVRGSSGYRSRLDLEDDG